MKYYITILIIIFIFQGICCI